jgi:hypothetical protein
MWNNLQRSLKCGNMNFKVMVANNVEKTKNVIHKYEI